MKYIDTSSIMEGHGHGKHQKDMMVLHETVSPDIAGLTDIKNVEYYLASVDYGIHGMTDLEGNIAWARGMGDQVFYHAGGVNARAAGIEQVSFVPELLAKGSITRLQATRYWLARANQLHATAALLAAWHAADPLHHILSYSDGRQPGVTSHWDVSQHFPESQGHTDCWPVKKGGYYPILEVIDLAKTLKEKF